MEVVRVFFRRRCSDDIDIGGELHNLKRFMDIFIVISSHHYLVNVAFAEFVQEGAA